MDLKTKGAVIATFEILSAEIVANENMEREPNGHGGTDIFCRKGNTVWQFRAAINGYPESISFVDADKMISWQVDEVLEDGEFKYEFVRISPAEFAQVQF